MADVTRRSIRAVVQLPAGGDQAAADTSADLDVEQRALVRGDGPCFAKRAQVDVVLAEHRAAELGVQRVGDGKVVPARHDRRLHRNAPAEVHRSWQPDDQDHRHRPRVPGPGHQGLECADHCGQDRLRAIRDIQRHLRRGEHLLAEVVHAQPGEPHTQISHEYQSERAVQAQIFGRTATSDSRRAAGVADHAAVLQHVQPGGHRRPGQARDPHQLGPRHGDLAGDQPGQRAGDRLHADPGRHRRYRQPQATGTRHTHHSTLRARNALWSRLLRVVVAGALVGQSGPVAGWGEREEQDERDVDAEAVEPWSNTGFSFGSFVTYDQHVR